jgi:hypothetical protein
VEVLDTATADTSTNARNLNLIIVSSSRHLKRKSDMTAPWFVIYNPSCWVFIPIKIHVGTALAANLADQTMLSRVLEQAY